MKLVWFRLKERNLGNISQQKKTFFFQEDIIAENILICEGIAQF